MRQIYNADSPLFWEEVLASSSNDQEMSHQNCSNLPKLFNDDYHRRSLSTERASGGAIGVVHQGQDVSVRGCAIGQSDNPNNCLSACTFASRLVLNNLLPSRFARDILICFLFYILCFLIDKYKHTHTEAFSLMLNLSRLAWSTFVFSCCFESYAMFLINHLYIHRIL